MKFKIGEAVWFIEKFGTGAVLPELNIGKLIDIQGHKAIFLLGCQDYSGIFEDVEWGIPLHDVFHFDDYEEAKKKLFVYASQCQKNQKETGNDTESK